MKRIRWAFLAVLVVGHSLPGSAEAEPIAAQIFLGDYNGSQVVRWSGDTPDTFVSAFGVGTNVEGMGGYSVGSGVDKVNHVLVGAGTNILDYIVNYPKGQSLAHQITNAGFSLQMTVANDGNSFYAAQGGRVAQFSIAPGNYGTLLHETAVKGPGGANADVWGVAVNPTNGYVLASANWANSGEGVQVGINEYDSNLHFIKSLVPYGDHGLTHGAGIVFAPDGQSFYVVQGGNAVPLSPDAFVLHYKADGTFIDKLTAPAGFLDHAFEPAIGPDGNLYVSNQAGNCVVRFDTTTDTFKDVFISASATSGNGEFSAKTIFFSTNTIPQIATPEPSSMVMALTGSMLLGGLALRRRAKVLV